MAGGPELGHPLRATKVSYKQGLRIRCGHGRRYCYTAGQWEPRGPGDPKVPASVFDLAFGLGGLLSRYGRIVCQLIYSIAQLNLSPQASVSCIAREEGAGLM